jgi:hypothetical protein
MTALTGTVLPAIAADRKTDLRSKTPVKPQIEVRGMSPQKWDKVLGRVAHGENIRNAIRGLKIAPSVLEGHLISDKKAKEQLDNAKIQALYRVWSEELLEDALVAIALGATVKQACAQVGLENKIDSFYRLIMRDPSAKEAYEEARMIQAEKMAIDDIIEISDDSDKDETFDGKPNSAAVNRARLMVDSRKWIASKLHYKRFGDRIQQDIEQNIVVDHAARLEAARKRKDDAYAKRKK